MAVITLENGAVFERPAERVREYCEIEVYRDRNYRGGYDDHHNVTDSVTAEDIEAANNLYAGLSSLDRGRITHSEEISARLAAIKDVELGKLGEEEWQAVRKDVGPLLSSFLSLHNIKLAKATKILHLKRPRLFPIVDSLIINFLTANDVDVNFFSTEELLRIGLDCLDIARRDLLRNRDAFAQLQQEIADLPVPLTDVRVYDILCWTQEKWVNRGDLAGPFGRAGRSLSQKASAPTPVGANWKEPLGEPQGEIRSIKEFRQVKLRAEGVIVTTGSKPPRAHRALCRELSEERFTDAVVFNEGKKGRYYLRNDLAEAVRDFQAVACMKCKPERPVAGRG
jgi:hypothetical protein